MDNPKPSPDPADYHEGEEAARRFVQGVRSVLSTSPEELRKRHEKWEKERKGKKKNQ